MNVAQIGISSGWGGLRTTPQFVDKFDTAKDKRYLLYDEEKSIADVNAMPEETEKEQKAKETAMGNIQKKDIDDVGNFSNGYGFQKFLNMNSDGTPGKALGFVDTDFPMMRYADVLLMAAECAARGASIDGLSAFNQVRARAGMPEVSTLSLNEIIDERGRELYQECWRRNDLIRFGLFTGSDYVWQWKGGVQGGTGVESYRALFPIPDSG